MRLGNPTARAGGAMASHGLARHPAAAGSPLRAQLVLMYDGLSLSGLHADALSWAAEAKKMDQARTATKGGPLVASSHLTRLGRLTGLEPATPGTTSQCSAN